MNMVYLSTYLGLFYFLLVMFLVHESYTAFARLCLRLSFRDRFLSIVIDNSKHSRMLTVGLELFTRYVDINIKNLFRPHNHT